MDNDDTDAIIIFEPQSKKPHFIELSGIISIIFFVAN